MWSSKVAESEGKVGEREEEDEGEDEEEILGKGEE